MVITAAHYLNATLGARHKKFYQLTAGVPRVVISQGQIIHEALHKEQLGVNELLSLLRQHQIEDIGKVDKAVLETDGKLSVFTTLQE